MHVLSLKGVTRAFDGRIVLEDVSFGVTTDDHVGVVGPNGSGKSTLLRIIAGEEVADDGDVVWNSAARATYLPQDPPVDDRATVLDVMWDRDDPSVERHHVDVVAAELDLDVDAPIGSLSGGMRRRAALARAVLPDSDLLILDEPTNHLDVDTIAWLEDRLRRRRGGLLVVTHDRYLLERLSNRMLEIDGGAVRWHEGTYTDLLEARATRAAEADAAERRRRNLLRKEIAWLRRGPKARTSKPKFRVEQVASIQAEAQAPDEATLDLGTGRRRLGKRVIDLEGVSITRGERPVLRDVTLLLARGDRIGIVGANGAGKTTLLDLMAGTLPPDAGSVVHGETVELAYYTQDATVPPTGERVIDVVRAAGERIPLANGDDLPATSLAERFLFDAALQQSRVADLSGGERRRLALLLALVRAPNVLLLDEPTNDLDLDTLATLEDHLDGFGGTLVVASHDRYLLDRLTDRLYEPRPDGGLVAHQDWERYREAGRAAVVDTPGEAPPTRPATRNRNRERQAARREIRTLETRMATLQSRREDLHTQLAGVGADHERARRLDAELRIVASDLADLEDRWLTLSVGIEA